jgi:DNA polymerase-3 subunit beta
MELIFERDNLWEAMQVVGSVAASRNTLPILANVLIKATEDQIQLAATDLEIGVKLSVEGQITDSGSITIPAKKLSDIVRELPPSTVKLTALSNDRVEIECENAKFRIVGLTDEEFPPLPEIGEDFLTLNSGILCNMIQKTVFAVSTEETRHFLNGIYFYMDSESITAVATDGKRLAVATQSQTSPSEKNMGVIIPTKAVNNILRTFTEDEDIKIALLENQIAFATEKMTFISRLIEGEYPDYEAVMTPAMGNEIDMVADTERLLSVIRRVSLLANPKTPSVKMVSKESELSVLASTPELGEAQEQFSVKTTGGNVEIAFNARFVMDVLRNIEADEVIFKFRDSLSPVLVMPAQSSDGDSQDTKAGENGSYMCVIMPMRL